MVIILCNYVSDFDVFLVTLRSQMFYKPKVWLLLHTKLFYILVIFGNRDKASATIFSLPLICKISNLNWLINSNQRAFLRETVALLCM